VKRVFFKKVYIQNFLSVGNEGIEISFQEGISLITGENRDKGGRNGVGKSSVVESIYWSLFGNTIRDIKRDKIRHNQSEGSCEVKLWFDIIFSDKKDEYVLSRKLDPNKIELYCNGTDITRSSMPKTDELIKELIGASEEVFQNAVIMTANNTMPFMAQKKVDKRKFIEGVLHLGVFSEILLQVRSNLNDQKKENDICYSKFIEKQRNIEIFQNQFSKEEEQKKEKLILLDLKIQENLKKIETESSLDLSELNSKKEKLQTQVDSKKNKIIKLRDLLSECNQSLEDLKKEDYLITHNLKKFNESLVSAKDKTKACPTCKRSYEKHDDEHIKKIIFQYEEDIKKLNDSKTEYINSIKNKKNECSKTFEVIKKLESDIESHLNEIYSSSMISNNINNLIQINKSVSKEIEEIKNSKNNFEILIETGQVELSKLELELDNIQKRISILESAKFIVSEEGVKTFIIKKLLSILNFKLNFYLQALEAPCKCEFNEVFEETIYNEKSIECSYFNFSGGERKRIDLAILFAFQDILRMQTGTSFSLSMYDELFDSALDEKGVNKILSILKERIELYKESIYIISHNKSAVRSEIDQVILLEKQEGVTRIVQ